MNTTRIVFALTLMPLSLAADETCLQITENITILANDAECRSSTDCASVDLPRELGCHRPVSKKAATEIRDLLDLYRNSCGPLLYTCYGPVQSVWCVKGQCVNKLKPGGAPYPQVTHHDGFRRRMR